jgi:hypothetical protein
VLPLAVTDEIDFLLHLRTVEGKGEENGNMPDFYTKKA